jgi:hypothetical protein
MRCRPWTDEEIAIAAEMHAARGQGVTRVRLLNAIATRLHRSMWSVESRLAQLGPTFRRTGVSPHRRRTDPEQHHVARMPRDIPDDVLADCEHRRWLEHDTLTGTICGDPLPGYSARERGR